jgi:hypothetical protein
MARRARVASTFSCDIARRGLRLEQMIASRVEKYV